MKGSLDKVQPVPVEQQRKITRQNRDKLLEHGYVHLDDLPRLAKAGFISKHDPCLHWDEKLYITNTIKMHYHY